MRNILLTQHTVLHDLFTIEIIGKPQGGVMVRWLQNMREISTKLRVTRSVPLHSIIKHFRVSLSKPVFHSVCKEELKAVLCIIESHEAKQCANTVYLKNSQNAVYPKGLPFKSGLLLQKKINPNLIVI